VAKERISNKKINCSFPNTLQSASQIPHIAKGPLPKITNWSVGKSNFFNSESKDKKEEKGSILFNKWNF